MRSYSDEVTLIAPDEVHDPNAKMMPLGANGTKMVNGPCLRFFLMQDEIIVELPGGWFTFGAIYPAPGTDSVRSPRAAPAPTYQQMDALSSTVTKEPKCQASTPPAM